MKSASFKVGLSKTGRPVPAILIVEGQLMTAESLAWALRAEGFDVRVVIPSTKRDLVDALTWNPDIVLLDLNLGKLGDGSRFVPLLCKTATVVALSQQADRVVRTQCSHAGAAAVIDKRRPFDDLVDVVRRIVAAKPEIGRDVGGHLLERRPASARLAPFLALTAREQSVLSMLMDGLAAGSIARESVVSVSTVRSQIKSILQKLGVNSQLKAVSMAREAGWSADRDRTLNTAPGSGTKFYGRAIRGS